MNDDSVEPRGWTLLINSGIDYYVDGRYAVFAQQLPTAGNLLHHAIEMCLKGALVKQGKSLAELRKLNHDLGEIYKEFKTAFPDHSADAFDPIIAELHKFEEIRYPDVILKKGMFCSIAPGKRPQLATQPWVEGPQSPNYELYLGEIDDLMGRVFSIARINFAAFTGHFNVAATTYLYERNEVFQASKD
jgi:hypothetical protein